MSSRRERHWWSDGKPGPGELREWREIPNVRVYEWEDWLMVRGPVPIRRRDEIEEGGHDCDHMGCPASARGDLDSAEHIVSLAKEGWG